MHAREQLREWLGKNMPIYEHLLLMGHSHGSPPDHAPVLPLLDALVAAAPQPIADDLRAARTFLGERHPPPWSPSSEPAAFMRERVDLKRIVEWLHAAAELAAEIPPSSITRDDEIPFTRRRGYRHRFVATGQGRCQRCGSRLDFHRRADENDYLQDSMVVVRCVGCPQEGVFPFRQPDDSPWSRGAVAPSAALLEAGMEKRYSVFISSTFLDLKEEREKVMQAVLRLGYIPLGMEMFPASNDTQREAIRRAIDLADYYVVLVAGRYGSRGPDNLSYTEDEFDYAVSQKIPVLAFVHGNPDSIQLGKTDKNDEARKRLEAFRERVSTGRVRNEWTNPDELAGKVTVAIISAVKTHPRPGWVRGVIDSEGEQRGESEKRKPAELEQGSRLLLSVRATMAQRWWSAFCEFERRVEAGVSPGAILPQPKGATHEERQRDSERLYREDVAARTKAVNDAWQVLKAVRDEAEAVLDERTFGALDAVYQKCDSAFREVWAARVTKDPLQLARATEIAFKKLDELKPQRAEALKVVRALIDSQGS